MIIDEKVVINPFLGNLGVVFSMTKLISYYYVIMSRDMKYVPNVEMNSSLDT